MAEITRANAAAVISEQKVSDIIEYATVGSVVLNTFEVVPMSKKVLSQPMVTALPDAHFVTDGTSTGDSEASGTKPTTNMTWGTRTMTAEEIAVIVPVHENLLADADIDIWAAIKPKIAEAFAIRLDNAVLYGDEAPASWATHANLVAKAITAGNVYNIGGHAANLGGLAEDFNSVFALVEDDGFDVNKVLAVRSLRSKLRGLRDANGAPLYLDGVRGDSNTSTIYGEALDYLHKRVSREVSLSATPGPQRRGVHALVLDKSQFQVGIREDFTVKFLDQATVNGINLAERDMVALRFKFRVAFGAFPLSPVNSVGDYPVALLTAAVIA